MASEYVPNQILTAEELNGSFDGKTDNADAKISGGYADGLDHVTITGIGASVSPTSGALIVTGGVGVGGSLNVANASIFGKELKVLSSLNTTSPSTGALTVAGGVGIGSNVQVGGAVAVVGNLTGARIVSTDATQSTSVSTGAVVTPGGLGVAKDTWIGGDLHVQGAFAAQGGATLQGGITVDSVTLNPGGDITYGDGTTQSTKPFDDVPTDGIKYGRKDKAWFVIADLPEAPADGKKYGRKDAAWTVLTDILEAPGDDFYYGRRNAAWAKVTEEAPMADAFIYGRANGLWVKSVTEAPSDGNQYSRRNGAWQVLSASGMWVGDVPPSDTARYPQWYDTTSSTLYVWYNDGTSSQWVICVPVPSTDDMSGAVWGAITGTIEDQTDLVAYVAAHGGSGVPEAPEDGKEYVRKDASWTENTGGTGVAEAPEDGTPYARQDAAWVPASSGGDGDLFSYMCKDRKDFSIEFNAANAIAGRNMAVTATQTVAVQNASNSAGSMGGSAFALISSSAGTTAVASARMTLTIHSMYRRNVADGIGGFRMLMRGGPASDIFTLTSDVTFSMGLTASYASSGWPDGQTNAICIGKAWQDNVNLSLIVMSGGTLKQRISLGAGFPLATAHQAMYDLILDGTGADMIVKVVNRKTGATFDYTILAADLPPVGTALQWYINTNTINSAGASYAPSTRLAQLYGERIGTQLT